MWELATSVESNLYLGQLTMVEVFYNKVDKVACRDISAKPSTHSKVTSAINLLWLQKKKKLIILGC